MLKYVTGNALEPVGEGKKLIIHCCNDAGGWGRGFVLAISARWPDVEKCYRSWAKNGFFYDDSKVPVRFRLGEIQPVEVEPGLYVVNMIGQRGYSPYVCALDNNVIEIPPIRYEAIRDCLYEVLMLAKRLNASVHGPR